MRTGLWFFGIHRQHTPVKEYATTSRLPEKYALSVTSSESTLLNDVSIKPQLGGRRQVETAQIIKNNKTGFTFTSESTSALVEILKDIANNYNDLHYLASNLNTFVKENYQAKQVVRQLLVGYQNEL